MEITCTRCHQAVREEDCYCPVCGLPQLMYTSADGTPAEEQQEQVPGAVRDASMVEWRPALRWAMILAIPAALLSSEFSPLGIFGMLWMASAAAWAVKLYVRQQRVPWITIGAGARIGMVTGLIAGWLAFGVGGCGLYFQRAVLHQASQIDTGWREQTLAADQLAMKTVTDIFPADVLQTVQAKEAQDLAWRLSPAGHAWGQIIGFLEISVFLVLFAIIGGAVGARLMGRTRPTEL
jgi:hypothetical protein